MRYFLGAITVLLSVFLKAEAQSATEQQLNFERVLIPGILSSASTVAIVQDPFGMLWFGTTDGLYRFDGNKFTKYHELQSGRSISGKQINDLLWDKIQNRLLITTRTYGIVSYSYADNSLKQLFENDADDPVILDYIIQTADGALWTTSYIKSIFKISNDSLVPLSNAREFSPSPTAFIADGNTIITGDVNGVQFFENGVPTKSIPLQWSNKSFSSNSRVTALFKDKQNKLWIGTEQDGMLIYDLDADDYLDYLSPGQYGFFGRINQILMDSQGLVWILTRSQGLATYNPSEDKLNFYSKNKDDLSGLSSDITYSILEDKTGIIWIGGIRELNKYDRNKIKFNHLYHKTFDPNSLSDNVIRGVYYDDKNILWLGTDAGFLNLYNFQTKKNERIKISLPGVNNIIIAFYFLEYGNSMLIGSSHGILLFDKHSKSFIRYPPIGDKFTGRARQLFLRGDDLYVLGQGNLFRFNIKTGEENHPTNFSFSEQAKRKFSPTGLFTDDENNLWISFYGGISKVLNEQDSIQVYDIDNFLGTSQSERNMVLCFRHAGDSYWIGTLHNGLVKLTISNDAASYSLYDEKNGLPNNTVYAVMPDANGFLWLATNLGIVRFNPATSQFITFDSSEGMQDEEFNRLAFASSQDGTLFFGGLNGINYFNPENIQINAAKVNPIILSMSFIYFNEEASAKYPHLQQTTMLPGKSKIDLPYSLNFFTLEFSNTNYHTPSRLQYYYRLENFDNDWIVAGNQNAATYRDLKPGKYTFKVKTVDLSGEESLAAIEINIASPFWLTWWFRILMISIVSMLIFFVIKREMNKNKKIQAMLEEALEIKTREIKESKAELERLNQKKDLIFSILSHDLRSPLTTLKGFLGILIKHDNVLSAEDIKKHAESIRNSVTKSLDLIDNTLFWSLSQMESIQYNPGKFELSVLTDKVNGLYQPTAYNKGIQLSFESESNIVLFADENMIYVTLRNLVSNALKFSPEGTRVNVSAITDGTYAIIEVSDQGMGISEFDQEKVLNPESISIKKGTLNEKGTGLGLILCKQFIELNKGEFKFSSKINEGSVFTVKLPLAKD